MAVVSRRAEGILGQVADGSWRFAGVREQVLWQENSKESVNRFWQNGGWSARFLDLECTVVYDSHSWGRYGCVYKTRNHLFKCWEAARHHGVGGVKDLIKEVTIRSVDGVRKKMRDHETRRRLGTCLRKKKQTRKTSRSEKSGTHFWPSWLQCGHMERSG